MVGTLLSKITALEERLKVCNKNLYASKSQKGINKKKREAEEDHTRDKDNFDSTLQSIESSLLQHGDDPMCEENAEAKPKGVVFVIKDCLIAPWVPTIRFAIIVIFVNYPQAQ